MMGERPPYLPEWADVCSDRRTFFTADYTLGILNRNPALGACHKYNEGDDGKEEQADADNCEVVDDTGQAVP